MTYYVVAYKMGSALVLLTPNSTSYGDALEAKDTAVNYYRGKRGIDLWTHVASGKQYVGSSRNLGNRLADYYRNGYLLLQSKRGSVISRALLLHGHSAFSLSVASLGPTLKDQMYSATNLSDYVVAEQFYLDSFPLVYNVNRIATSAAYTPSTSPINVGINNPSYGLTGITSPVWGSTHSDALKALWSSTRGKYNFFVYDPDTLLFVVSFTSASQLSQFIPNVSKRFGTDIYKSLQSAGSPALRYGHLILSIMELTPEQINDLMAGMPIMKVKLTRPDGPNSTIIYGLNPGNSTHHKWGSLEKCTHELTGKRFENKATVNRRLNKGIIFHGYLLQTKPFSK